MGKSSREGRRSLFEVAMSQQGLFTATQAAAAGYSPASMTYQVKSGNWIREMRGIYSLPQFPLADRTDLVLWSLWSRDSGDVPQGIFSHQTALSIFDITDLMPAKLHMTVPPTFRRRDLHCESLVLHRGTLAEQDIRQMPGFQVTCPLKAIRDLYIDQTVHPGILKEALAEGVQKGVITYFEIQKALSADLPQELIDGTGIDKAIQLFNARFPQTGTGSSSQKA